MNCKLTIQEILKDLRTEKGLSLEELQEKTGISKSALGSYESNDFKDITHTAIVKLAEFYGVSTDYILGLTENRTEGNTPVSELKLDDDTIKILKSGNINNRLLCEMIKHPDFWKFMSDTEIYVDSLASMQIRNLNSFVAIARTRLQLKNHIPDSDHYMRTLKACEVNEDDYFSRLICEDITTIAKDIKESHHRDAKAGDGNDPLGEVIDIVKEYSSTTDPMKATLSTLSRQLGMNFNKMDAMEIDCFKTLVEKYSTVYKNMLPKKGRGKKKQ